MATITVDTPLAPLSDDLFALLLEEAENALDDVAGRPDSPNLRIAFHERGERPDLAELRLALAELADTYRGVEQEVALLGEKLRSTGVASAASELEARPHLLQLMRLALEIHFRRMPSHEPARRADLSADDLPVLNDAYEAYRLLREMLRDTLS